MTLYVRPGLRAPYYIAPRSYQGDLDLGLTIIRGYTSGNRDENIDFEMEGLDRTFYYVMECAVIHFDHNRLRQYYDCLCIAADIMKVMMTFSDEECFASDYNNIIEELRQVETNSSNIGRSDFIFSWRTAVWFTYEVFTLLDKK